MYEKNGHRVSLEVNLTRLQKNLTAIKELVHPLKVIGVLKANAYGIGVFPVAEALVNAGVKGFGVAELREALALKPLGLPIQILGGVLEEEIPQAVAEGIILPVTDLETAELINTEALRQKKRTPVELLIDTGMGRLGFLAQEALQAIPLIAALPGLDAGGIYSHFPVAYRGEDDAFNRRQLSLFMTLLDNLAEQGLRFPKVHIANSDAVNNLPWTYKKPFTHVRVGLNLHGSFESEGNRAVTLESIFTLKTRVVSIRTLPAGMTVGYGRTYTLKQPTRVGTIAAGYADGLPLALSNRGYVLVRGKPCPVLGRLSMDYTTISLENAPEASRGDEVVCLGRDGDEEITVDAWAQLKGTHAYDIICSFGNRVSRRYI